MPKTDLVLVTNPEKVSVTEVWHPVSEKVATRTARTPGLSTSLPPKRWLPCNTIVHAFICMNGSIFVCNVLLQLGHTYGRLITINILRILADEVGDGFWEVDQKTEGWKRSPAM